MSIILKFNSSLKKYLPEGDEKETRYELTETRDLKTILESYGINLIDVGFCTLNGKMISKLDILKTSPQVSDHDYVEVFTELKGG